MSEVIYPDGQKKYQVTTIRLSGGKGIVGAFFDHGDEIKLFDNRVDALDFYANKLDDHDKWDPPRRKPKSGISEIRRIVREAGMLEDQLQDDILEELELGQGTAHIDQLLDMFRTKYPGVPIEDFHDVMQILERSQVISLEGSSGFYHLNRPYLDEGMTMKITRRQIRRIIREVNRRPDQDKVITELTKYLADLQKKYKRRPDVISADQYSPLQIFIKFSDKYGRRSSHGVVQIVINTRRSVEVAVKWFYGMGDSVEDPPGSNNFVSQESGEEDLKLADWADPSAADPEYIAEDYVRHVKEFIDQILDATSAGAVPYKKSKRR